MFWHSKSSGPETVPQIEGRATDVDGAAGSSVDTGCPLSWESISDKEINFKDLKVGKDLQTFFFLIFYLWTAKFFWEHNSALLH